MSKSLWIGGIALMLLSSVAARAADEDEGRTLRFGPAEIRLAPGSVEVEVDRVEAPNDPVQVQVQAKQGPGRGVQVQAGPVDVFVGRGIDVAPEPIKLGEYWLGAQCRFVGEALRSQLGLPEDQGLVVESVVDEGPAAKAGIEAHDVLIKAGQKPLKSIRDLIDEVEKTKEQELAIELIRGGQKQTVTVTPAKRPEDARPKDDVQWVPGPGEYDGWDQWLRGLLPGDVTGPFRLRVFRPGLILPHGVPVHPPLPGNLTISITRQGDNPAKIVVERDDQRWELTEKELDKLPKDVRPHVERMLGPVVPGMVGGFHTKEFIPHAVPTAPPAPPFKVAPKHAPEDSPRGRVEKRLERRMEEMNERIETLRETIEGLRQQAPQGGEAPPATEAK